MTTVTLELSDTVINAVRQQAQSTGKDFTRQLQEHLEIYFRTSEPISAHLDPSRCITAEQLRQHARERHGFPPEWGTNPQSLAEADWELLDAAFAPESEPIK